MEKLYLFKSEVKMPKDIKYRESEEKIEKSGNEESFKDDDEDSEEEDDDEEEW